MNSFYTEEELSEIGLKSYGTNVKISRKVSIYGASNISIGNNVRIDDFCILSGKIKLGSNIHIAVFCGLFGGDTGICLEDYSGLSSRIMVYAETDDYSGEFLTNPTIDKQFLNIIKGEVIIKKHSIVGTSSVVLPSVVIGEGVSVGALSLVNKSLESWGVYVGIPCKKIKERSKNLLELEEKMQKEL
ncbi:MAG: acyltransferase [Bacteroidales bacterium]